MITPASPDPVVTAQRMTAAMEGLEARLREAVAASEEASRQRDDALDKYNRRSRRLVVGAIVSVAIDIALSVVVAVFAVQAHTASNAATHASASNLALCRASNVARHQQVSLWMYLIDLGTPPKTKQGRELISKFEHHLLVVFAPRDCVKLGSKKS